MAPRPPVVPDRRCGWPEHCTQPDDWHYALPGRRPWTAHDIQCQIPQTRRGTYPECTMADGHDGPCTPRPRHHGGALIPANPSPYYRAEKAA